MKPTEQAILRGHNKGIHGSRYPDDPDFDENLFDEGCPACYAMWVEIFDPNRKLES